MGDSIDELECHIDEKVNRIGDDVKELQDLSASFISKSLKEEQHIRQKAAAIDSSISKLRSTINSLLFRRRLDPNLAEKLEDDLNRASCILIDGDASSFLPSKAEGTFLRMFLGPINVRATRKDVKLKVKEEYNSYKDRTALLFLLFPSILLILRSWVWNGCMPAFPVQLYQAWLLFLYSGLALRENILRVNGSDIRSWWICHHYCAMVMALVSLTWEIKGQPNCAQKQRGVELFLQWAVMQGVAMLLQNRYQRQRLYTRIALGKVHVLLLASLSKEEKKRLNNLFLDRICPCSPYLTLEIILPLVSYVLAAGLRESRNMYAPLIMCNDQSSHSSCLEEAFKQTRNFQLKDHEMLRNIKFKCISAKCPCWGT